MIEKRKIPPGQNGASYTQYARDVEHVITQMDESLYNMSETEANWWINLAKKEYFFPHDRNKTYQEE